MKPIICTFLVTLLICQHLFSQQPAFEYTGPLEKNSLTVAVLSDKADGSLSLAFADDNSVQYVRVNKDFGTGKKITMNTSIKGEIHAYSDAVYVGGLSSGNISHFLYWSSDNGLYDEIVDFSKNTATVNKIASRNNQENGITAYAFNGRFNYISANNESKQLILYELTSDGTFNKRRIKYPVPENASPNYNLSRHLMAMKQLDQSAYRSLETGRSWSLLYDFGDSVNILVDLDKFIELVTINRSDMTATSRRLVPKGYDETAKGDTWFDTQLIDNKLFTLVTQKDKFTVLACDMKTAKWSKLFDINDDTPLSSFIQPPYVINTARSSKEGEIDIKEAIRKIYKGYRAFNVRSEQGKYIFTIGDYNLIPTSITSGPDYVMGSTNVYGGGSLTPNDHYFIPRKEGYWTPSKTIGYDISGNYYSSTFFEIALDPVNMQPVSGNDFSKPEFVNAIAKTNNQNVAGPAFFSWNNKNYKGAYDRKEKKYVIEEIVLEKNKK